MQKNKYSANDITLCVRDSLMQKGERDTCSFAVKVYALHSGVEWIGVCKELIKDKTKKRQGEGLEKNEETQMKIEKKEI